MISSPVQTTSYDGDGNVVQQVDGNGDVTTSSYDPLDRQVATTDPVSGTSLITYTATEKVATQDPHGYVTLDSYDGAGRLLLETDPLSGTTQYQYDPVGNTVAITGGTASAATQVETRQYDALDEVITDTLLAPSQPPSTTATAYDTDGNVVFTQQPNGDQTGDAYDRADQLLQTWVLPVSGPAGPYENYSYDNAGNQTEYDDMDSRVHQASYDGDDRLIQTVDTYTSTNTLTTTYGYDPDGNIISQVETSVVGHTTRTHSTTNSYNVVDWRTGSTDTPASGAPLPTSYGYDGAGQERSETVIDGVTPVTMTLDAEGRTMAIAEGYGGSGPYTTSYSYDPNDLPISATLPGSVQDNWGYDQNNRLITGSLVGPSGVITPLNSQYGYGYNALGWTTAVTTTLNGVGSTQTITHDALGRMTGDSSPGSVQSWSYDGNGNLLTAVNNGSTTSYAYDSSVPNEVQSTTTGGVTTDYSYDQNGDTTSITNTAGTVNTALSYDSQARLSVVTLKDGTTVTMSYNAQGQRASYVVSKGGVSSLTEQFTYRGDALAQAVISSTQKYTDTYLYDPNGAPLELLRQYQNGTTGRYWYVLDGRGTVVALTGINGDVVDSYSYDAWGKLTSASEAVPQRLRYAGYWYDQELGWYWVSVREYAPGLKRWLQPDQSAIDGLRTYVYVGDDPIDVSDPSGLGSCNGSHDFFSFIGDVACNAGNAIGGAAHGVFQFVAGDDLDTINSEHASGADKFLAVLDLSSNALSIIPIFGEGVEAAKLLAKGAAKLGAKVVTREISYDEAKALARQLVRRGAKEAAACAWCFPAGTLVTTATGLVPIQRLHVGARVLAEDTATGKVEAEPVQAVIQDPVSPLIAVGLSDGSAITVTADHPFWVDAGAWLASPGWLPADQLRMGDRLRTANGLGVLVVGLRRNVGHAVVYTLTVATDHSYFVGSGHVLVHNADPVACEALFNSLADNMVVSESEAFDLAEEFLGPGYREIPPNSGEYLSEDGLRRVRIQEGDITGAHGQGPHFNFEMKAPNPNKPWKLQFRNKKHILILTED